MHSVYHSLGKRWHSLLANPKKMRRLWGDAYWHEDKSGVRNVSCRHCPRFDAIKKACTVKFGTSLRKCVVGSIEAHLNNCRNKNVLEIGYGRFALAKNLIKRSGGIWAGIDPLQPKNKIPTLGCGGYGRASEIPFANQTFDVVCGVQTIAHWGQKATGKELSNYNECTTEIFRVLKPGGQVYFDVPMHFHGHEMFIMADLDRIKGIFPPAQWENLTFEKWRYNYEPLERYAPFPKLFPEWTEEISSYSADQVEHAKGEPIHLLVMTAKKVG